MWIQMGQTRVPTLQHGGYRTREKIESTDITKGFFTPKLGATFPTTKLFGLVVRIKTGSAGKTWTIQDQDGVEVAPALAVDVAGWYLFTFSTQPELAVGNFLKVIISAAGAEGEIFVDGYPVAL
jgi:hypothetical protein